MSLFRRVVDNRNRDSLASKMRRKRFGFFADLLQSVPSPVTVLDVGGTQEFWEVMGFTDISNVQIALLNPEEQGIRHGNFSSIVGDATNLSGIDDGQFDVVFSNSVIEHVGNYDQQRRMAQEIQRVGKRYFVQTPNYFFPIEPHFVFFGFHWLPVSMRVFLINHFDLGWIKRIPDPNEARKLIEGIRLLRKGEFLTLFPGAKLCEERVLGLTKSFVVYGGW